MAGDQKKPSLSYHAFLWESKSNAPNVMTIPPTDGNVSNSISWQRSFRGLRFALNATEMNARFSLKEEILFRGVAA